MKIAILSGKGGAGKTFVSVNLAASQKTAVYVDCDVEEPNGRLFFKIKPSEQYDVYKMLPVFDAAKCNGCRKCVDFCRFHALAYIKDHPKLFKDICHSCGGCSVVCPENAITEEKKCIGKVELGKYQNVQVVTGIVNEGEASGVKVIEKALEIGENCCTQYANPVDRKQIRDFSRSKDPEMMIIDCPPGSGCSVMDSLKKSDYCILVVEATVFGFHNFQMVYELATILKKPVGVIVNKEENKFEKLYEFCKEKSIPILATIPYDEKLAKMISEGDIVVEKDEEYRTIFQSVIQKIGGECS